MKTILAASRVTFDSDLLRLARLTANVVRRLSTAVPEVRNGQ